MLLDTLAVVARKDDPDRRKRQAQGIAKAKAAGLYRGRQSDIERERLIRSMLEKGAGPMYVPPLSASKRPTQLPHWPPVAPAPLGLVSHAPSTLCLQQPSPVA